MGMMFGGNQGRFFQQETLKPKRVGETLSRLGRYFAPFWPALIAVAVLVVVGTYAQVRAPELIGQAVDCYLAPAMASRMAAAVGGAPGAAPAGAPAGAAA